MCGSSCRAGHLSSMEACETLADGLLKVGLVLEFQVSSGRTSSTALFETTRRNNGSINWRYVVSSIWEFISLHENGRRGVFGERAHPCVGLWNIGLNGNMSPFVVSVWYKFMIFTCARCECLCISMLLHHNVQSILLDLFLCQYY